MKMKLFIVQVLMVLVACLVFSMSAESATGGDIKLVEIVNEAQNPVPVRNINTKIPLMLYSGKVICKGQAECQTKIYEGIQDGVLRIEYVAIRIELIKDKDIDINTRPCITLLWPDPNGPIIPIINDIASFTYTTENTRIAVLSKNYQFTLPDPAGPCIFRINSEPNKIDNFTVVLTGHIINDKRIDLEDDR